MTWADRSLQRFRQERADRELLRRGDSGLLESTGPDIYRYQELKRVRVLRGISDDGTQMTPLNINSPGAFIEYQLTGDPALDAQTREIARQNWLAQQGNGPMYRLMPYNPSTAYGGLGVWR